MTSTSIYRSAFICNRYLKLFHHPPTSASRLRYFASRPRPDPNTFLFRPKQVDVIEDVAEKLKADQLTYRRHPGVTRLPVQKVDDEIRKAIGLAIQQNDYPVSAYTEPGKDMEQHLQNRRLPPEPHDIRKLGVDIEERVRIEEAKKLQTKADYRVDEERLQKKVLQRIKTSIYRWRAMDYDDRFKCLTYTILRFAPEHAVLRRVLNEIVKREADYRPRHVLDFGSGVGTTFFACESSWPKSIDEYMCVDTSQAMNDLFDLFLRRGDPKNGELFHKNVTLRQFLPASTERRFDLVVSAFSLFELPSYEERMRTVVNLWSKTNDFLILIERGTNAGYRAVIEARDYILAGGREIHRRALSAIAREKGINMAEAERILDSKKESEAEKFNLLRQRYPDLDFPTLLPHGHIFAPCPHDMGCPRLMDVTPCNFPVRYFPLRLKGGAEEPRTEIFSFVILRKGYAPAFEDRWPRVVRQPRKSKGRVWCQMCSPHGVLEDQPFSRSKSPSRIKYEIAKRIEWGDSIPFVTNYDETDDAATASGAMPDEAKEESEDEDEIIVLEEIEDSDEGVIKTDDEPESKDEKHK